MEAKFCPVLVACSAFIDKNTEKRAILAGFELVIQSPLTIQMLRDKIIVKALEKKAIFR